MSAPRGADHGDGRRRTLGAATSTSRGRARCSRPRPTSRSGSRRSSRSSIPRRSSSRTASRTSTPPVCEDDLLAESAAGELIASEIEIRSGQGRELRRGDGAPARAPGAAVRARRRAWGLRSPRWGRIRGPTTSTSGSSTRLTTRGCARSCGGWRSATTPGAFTSTSACGAPTARSPSATTCAAVLPAAARGVGELAVPRRPRHRPALGAHRDLHPHLPALRGPRAVRQLGGVRGLHRPAGPHRLDRRGDPALVERPPAPRLRHRRAADLRRADARARSRSALAGADRGLHRAERARLRRRAAAASRWASGRSRRTSGGRSATAWTAR